MNSRSASTESDFSLLPLFRVHSPQITADNISPHVCLLQSTLFAGGFFFYLNGKMETASTGSFFKSHVSCALQSLLSLINKVHARSMFVVYTQLVSLFHPRPEFCVCVCWAVCVLGGVCGGIKVHDIHFPQ